MTQLRRQLSEATAIADSAAEALFEAAARSHHIRVAMDELAERREAAKAALGRRARAIYMHGQPDPFQAIVIGLAAPDLAIAARGERVGLQTDDQVISELGTVSKEIAALRGEADRMRAQLLTYSASVYAAQDRARRLLGRAEEAARADAMALAQLAAQRAQLNYTSNQIAFALAPGVTERGRCAAATEAPVIAFLETSGPGIPPGYHPTGVTISGIASWYGPGFVGNPTASGSPYDPERLTAAMLPPVPLGTIVHVSSADGLSINVLVNDRGPYGAGRVIDLSRAGSRLMGFDGLKQVTVELLAPN